MPEEMSAVEKALKMFGEWADEIGLEGDEKTSFVDSSMERKGFKRVSSWAEPEPEGGNGGGDFFSRRREGNRSGGRSNDGFTQYRSG